MSMQKNKLHSDKKEIVEIDCLLKSRYFNRSAAIAKINYLIHIFPQGLNLIEKYNISHDFPIFYTSNEHLKELLLDFRSLIESFDEK